MPNELAPCQPLPDAIAPQINLPVPKAAAMETLMAGGNMADAARKAGVARQTVYEWLKSDSQFASAYQSWKQEMAESTRTRLLMLTESATETVEKAIRNGDARTAIKVLQGMGLLAAPAVGRTLPELRAAREDADGRIKQDQAQRSESKSKSDKKIRDMLDI